MGIELKNIIIRVWPVGVLLLAGLTILYWRKKRSFYHAVAFVLGGIYLLALIDKVFFPIQVSGAYAEAMRTHLPFDSQINLLPFNFPWYDGPVRALRDFVLNILLTVPFGFGIHFVWRIPQKRSYWMGLWLGLGIELTQLLISLILGFPYRVVDINDLLANMLGMWIGYWFFLGFVWVYRKMLQSRVRGELGAYLDNMIGYNLGKLPNQVTQNHPTS